MKEVTIYTDGACAGNPGTGGWAAVLEYRGNVKEIWGGPVEETTNIRMEMTAVLEALKILREPCNIKLHTDLQLISDAFNKRWIQSWCNNGWRTSKGEAVKNSDLWVEIVKVSAKHKVTVVKVKGHSGDPMNERCDELAKKAASGV